MVESMQAVFRSCCWNVVEVFPFRSNYFTKKASRALCVSVIKQNTFNKRSLKEAFGTIIMSFQMGGLEFFDSLNPILDSIYSVVSTSQFCFLWWIETMFFFLNSQSINNTVMCVINIENLEIEECFRVQNWLNGLMVSQMLIGNKEKKYRQFWLGGRHKEGI